MSLIQQECLLCFYCQHIPSGVKKREDPVTQGFCYDPIWLHTEDFLICLYCCLLWECGVGECDMCSYLLREEWAHMTVHAWKTEYDTEGLDSSLLIFTPWSDLSLNLELRWKAGSKTQKSSLWPSITLGLCVCKSVPRIFWVNRGSLFRSEWKWGYDLSCVWLRRGTLW